MAPPTTTSISSAELNATYKSPTSNETFSHDLAAGIALHQISELNNQAQVSKAKTVYLSELRSTVKLMQGDINKFLTAKMEEDKKIPASNGASSNGKRNDEVEEEKYGEEDFGEDG